MLKNQKKGPGNFRGLFDFLKVGKNKLKPDGLLFKFL